MPTTVDKKANSAAYQLLLNAFQGRSAQNPAARALHVFLHGMADFGKRFKLLLAPLPALAHLAHNSLGDIIPKKRDIENMRHLMLPAGFHNAFWALIRKVDDRLSKERKPKIHCHKAENMVQREKCQVLERAIRRIIHNIVVLPQKIFRIFYLLRHGKAVICVYFGRSRSARCAKADHIRPFWLIIALCLFLQQFLRAQQLYARVSRLFLRDKGRRPRFLEQVLRDGLFCTDIQQNRDISAHQNAPKYRRPFGGIFQLDANAPVFCPHFLFQRLPYVPCKLAIFFICEGDEPSIFRRQLRSHTLPIAAHNLKNIAEGIALGELFQGLHAFFYHLSPFCHQRTALFFITLATITVISSFAFAP